MLFVSHNMNAVRALCGAVALLEKGCILAQGDPPTVIRRYGDLFDTSLRKVHAWNDNAQTPGNDRIRLHGIELKNGEEPSDRFTMSDAISVVIRYSNLTENAEIAVNVVLYSMDGSEVLEDWSIEEENWSRKAMPRGMFKTVCRIPGNLLNTGTFRIRIIFFDKNAIRILYEYDEPVVFSVSDEGERNVFWHGRYVGHVHPRLKWATEHLGDVGS